MYTDIAKEMAGPITVYHHTHDTDLPGVAVAAKANDLLKRGQACYLMS